MRGFEMTRTVTVPARGKRLEFNFTYDAIPVEKATSAQLANAWLSFQDSQAISEHTTAAQEAKMLGANFKNALKFMARQLGLDKAKELLLSSGGYEELSEADINEAIDEVKNPKPRAKRGSKKAQAVAA
jgi:hypothetical protein